MPQLSPGEKLIYDTYDEKLKINYIDGEEVSYTHGSLGEDIGHAIVRNNYHSADISDVWADIIEQNNISSNVDLNEYDYRIDVYESTFTCREMIGFIASLIGKNAVFDRNGCLSLRWYEPADLEGDSEDKIIITRQMQYLDGFERTTDGAFIINSITSGTQDNVITAGDGYGISFTNPFMTKKRLDEIFANTAGMKITPCTLKYRGIPLLECTDIVTEESSMTDIHIMAQTFVFGKGMNSVISVHGESEAAAAIEKSPTNEKLEQMYSGLKNAFKESIETIVGVKGGYFELIYDEDSSLPMGWRIMDTPILTENTKVWTMNKNGLYFSSDGGQSIDGVAIDMLGNINASMINTGYLNTERIAVENYSEGNPKNLGNFIHFNNGCIILGETSSAIALKIENDRIAFYDSSNNPLAYFSNDSFSIENIQKVQISDFAYLKRSNGNLTFTKMKQENTSD